MSVVDSSATRPYSSASLGLPGSAAGCRSSFLDPAVLPRDEMSHLTAHQISFADCKVGS